MSIQSKQSIGIATASLVFGIIAIVFFFIPFIGLVAVICGHIAHTKIRRNPEELSGSGKATAGLVMGYLQIISVPIVGIAAAIVLPAVGDALNEAKQTATEIKIKFVKEELIKYNVANKKIPKTLSDVEGVTADILNDHWEQKIIYTLNNNKTFTLTSLGKDGIQSEDDIIVKASF